LTSAVHSNQTARLTPLLFFQFHNNKVKTKNVRAPKTLSFDFITAYRSLTYILKQTDSVSNPLSDLTSLFKLSAAYIHKPNNNY